MTQPAERTKKITYAIRDVVVEAKKLEKQGHKIIYLNIGDPLKYDFSTPEHMIDAVEINWHKSSSYADSHGLLEAREAVAREASRLGIKNITEEDVLITSGGSEGITMALGALVNKGENVLVPKPGYPLYMSALNYIEAGINEYYLDEENDWQPDVEDIKKKVNDKTRAIVIINPNNPTGALYTKETLLNIIEVAKEHNLMIFADETYDKILLDDDEFYAAASLTGDVPVVTFNTLSKSYLCPGWRVGWAIFSNCNPDYAEAVKKLARARLSISHPMQYAVKEALEGDQQHVTDMIIKLRKRRDIIFEKLNSIPKISCVRPKAAFYAFPKIEIDVSDKEFVLDFLKKEHVLLVFGSGFGQKPGEKHFRIVFAASEDALNTAMEKLEKYMKENF